MFVNVYLKTEAQGIALLHASGAQGRGFEPLRARHHFYCTVRRDPLQNVPKT
jgi:hypothetical protein